MLCQNLARGLHFLGGNTLRLAVISGIMRKNAEIHLIIIAPYEEKRPETVQSSSLCDPEKVFWEEEVQRHEEGGVLCPLHVLFSPYIKDVT